MSTLIVTDIALYFATHTFLTSPCLKVYSPQQQCALKEMMLLYGCTGQLCWHLLYRSWNKAKSYLTVLSFQFILPSPLEPVEWVCAKRVPSKGLLYSNYTLKYISCWICRSSPKPIPKGRHWIHSKKWTQWSFEVKGARLTFLERATIHEKKKKNAFHTSIVSIYSMTHLNTYIMCVFYIVVFGMTLVWGISTNAPNKGCPRALRNTEIPFPPGSLAFCFAVASRAC